MSQTLVAAGMAKVWASRRKMKAPDKAMDKYSTSNNDAAGEADEADALERGSGVESFARKQVYSSPLN